MNTTDHTPSATSAYRHTLRDLHRSIALGRPMSLPNCLRLLRRRLHAIRAATADRAAAERQLRDVYLHGQPFARSRMPPSPGAP